MCTHCLSPPQAMGGDLWFGVLSGCRKEAGMHGGRKREGEMEWNMLPEDKMKDYGRGESVQ